MTDLYGIYLGRYVPAVLDGIKSTDEMTDLCGLCLVRVVQDHCNEAQFVGNFAIGIEYPLNLSNCS